MIRELADPLEPEVLVKVDVQGYEDRVIRGATQVLERALACLLEVNVDNLYERQANFRDLFMSLDSLKFRYVGNFEQFYAEDGRVLFLDALFMK